MQKTSIIVIVLFTFMTIIFISCSSTKTNIIGEWQDDTYKKGNIEKVLVLGIVNKEKPLLRRKFEDGMAKAFNDGGIYATPSMDKMPYDVAIDSASFEKYFKDLDVDAVVVSRLVAVDASRDYTAGYLYTIPFNSYYGFYGYYYAGVTMANSTGYLSQDVVVVLETNIYETTNKKLIWSGVSETVQPDKASDVINSFSDLLVSKLKGQGYFK
ncbi:MAG: hypothetical protein MUE93_01820 [Ignavibacteriaceae bacterium]|nr:hypothetical protein [Ignavibacteriaceae bacterium]MCU0413300.1 hypothetical protein [Ignavibacteriaceae bacterium]